VLPDGGAASKLPQRHSPSTTLRVSRSRNEFGGILQFGPYNVRATAMGGLINFIR
jgi:hypothetical protein